MILPINNNELSKKETYFDKRCKQCNSYYKIYYDDVSIIPIWKFENCSRECALRFSVKKVVNLNVDKKFLCINKSLLKVS